MLRDLNDKDEVSRINYKYGSTQKCNYKSCLIQTQFIYDKLIEEMEDRDREQFYLQKELEARLN